MAKKVDTKSVKKPATKRVYTKKQADVVPPPSENKLLNIIKSLFNHLFGKFSPLYIIGACIILMAVAYFFFFSPSAIKEENNKLKKDIENIQKERDLLKDSVNMLKDEYIKLDGIIKTKDQELSLIIDRINQIERNIAYSYNQLNQIKNGVKDINSQVGDLKKNPVKRQGNELINSLKTKVN